MAQGTTTRPYPIRSSPDNQKRQRQLPGMLKKTNGQSTKGNGHSTLRVSAANPSAIPALHAIQPLPVLSKAVTPKTINVKRNVKSTSVKIKTLKARKDG